MVRYSNPPLFELAKEEGVAVVCLTCGCVDPALNPNVCLYGATGRSRRRVCDRPGAGYQRISHINERISQDCCLEPTIESEHRDLVLAELDRQLAQQIIVRHPVCSRHRHGLYKPHFKKVFDTLKRRPDTKHIRWNRYLEKWKSLREDAGVHSQPLTGQQRCTVAACMVKLSAVWNGWSREKRGGRSNFPSFNVMFRYILDYLVHVGFLTEDAYDTYDWPVPGNPQCLRILHCLAAELFVAAGVTDYTPPLLQKDPIQVEAENEHRTGSDHASGSAGLAGRCGMDV